MGYYSRHAIFLMDNDIQKLKTIQKLLEDKDIYFVIRKQTVYLENGEPLRIPCISDVNWNSGMVQNSEHHHPVSRPKIQ